MKLKIKDIIEILDSIESLSNKVIPIKIAWKMERLRKRLMPFFEEYTNSIELIKKEKALKNIDGSFVLAKTERGTDMPELMVFDPRDVDFLDSQITELLEEEKEIEDVYLLKIHEFPNTEIPLEFVRGLDKILIE